MELSGKVLKINKTQLIGQNNFKKRDLVLETEEQYPQKILIEFIQDKCELLDNFNINDKVTIAINLRGREWTNNKGETKYFNSFQGWKITKIENIEPFFDPNSDLETDLNEKPPF